MAETVVIIRSWSWQVRPVRTQAIMSKLNKAIIKPQLHFLVFIIIIMI